MVRGSPVPKIGWKSANPRQKSPPGTPPKEPKRTRIISRQACKTLEERELHKYNISQHKGNQAQILYRTE